MLILIAILSVTNFLINTAYVYEYKDEEVENIEGNIISGQLNSKSYNVVVYETGVKIIDGHQFNKEERFIILSKIKKHIDKQGIELDRTINNLEAEWSLHNYLYQLNFATDSTKDADLEYLKDDRWYVQTSTLLLQILGI